MRIKGKAVTSVSIERDQTRPGQRQQRGSDQTRAWVSRLVNVDADVDLQLWGPPTPAPPTILSPLTPSIDTWLFPRALLGLQSPSSLTCGSPLHVATTPLPRVSLTRQELGNSAFSERTFIWEERGRRGRIIVFILFYFYIFCYFKMIELSVIYSVTY